MRTLNDTQLGQIFEKFFLGMQAYDILEVSSHISLVQSACGDFEVTTTQLMARPAKYGESKWASLQATEN